VTGGAVVEVYPDPEALAQAVAERFVARAVEAVAARGRFAVALAGGTTPRAAYALLALPHYAARVDWARVHVFWGDERCVPPEHPDSNYRMARQALLEHVPIPLENVHRLRGELDPRQAADACERELRSFFAGGPPAFDLVLLGLGRDGHTASLFPGAAAPGETGRWAVAEYVEALGAWRLTLTPVLFNAAAEVIFMVSGADKAERLRQVIVGPYQPQRLPAQAIRPVQGNLRWLVDAAAAGWLVESAF